MSICSHMIEECPSTCLQMAPKQNIQGELIWGLSYRNYKEQERNNPIKPLHSPIDIPFKLCRAELLNKRRKYRKESDSKISDKVGHNIDEESQKTGASGDKKPVSSSKKRKRDQVEKPSLLDRSVMSQSRYMDFLSQPNPKFYEEPKQKRWKKRCELEPCPPRFVQLAVPNRRRVFANWKDFCDSLPAEMLKRYDDILHTDQNLEPREARYYFKKLDREKRKKLREKKRQEKKKKEHQEDPVWQKEQIEDLATAILDYLKDEPLFSLNYKQMLLSDGIIERLEQTNIGKNNKKVRLSRNTKDHYKKTIIEVADKSAIWIDTLTRFVDIQAIDSEIDIAPVSFTSLEDEGESEYSYEGESEEEGGSSEGEDGLGGGIQHVDQFGEDDMQDIVKESEDIVNDLFRVQEGEDEDDLDDFLNDLNGDQLEKLIQILGNCSEEFLDGEVDGEKMPGVKYEDILQKLKDIKEGKSFEDTRKKPFLEKVITDWAMQNDPDKVDKKLLNKIREISALIEDMLGQPGGDKGVTPGEQEGEGAKEGEGEERVEGPQGGETAGEGGAPEDGAEGALPGEGGAPEEADDGTERPDDTSRPRGTEDFGFGAPSDAGITPGTEGAEGASPGTEGGEEGSPEAPQDGVEGEEDAAGTEGATPSREGEEGAEDVLPGEGGEGPEGPGAEGEGATEAGEGEERPVTVTDFEGEEGVPGLAGPMDLGEEGGAITDLEGLEGEEGVFIPEDEGAKPPTEGVTTEEEGPEGEAGVPRKKPAEGEKEIFGEGIIKGHKPTKTFEHSLDTVCCLSLKTWAVWLLEITHNAHNWTKWMSGVIHQVREYAATVRGDVKNPDGTPKALKKSEWRKFCKETEENVIAWRQYSSHVKDLSNSIVENFHGKSVNCCPKCLEDHLIKNVVNAHETLRSLTEAINCAGYWQRTLDGLVGTVAQFSGLEKEEPTLIPSSSSSSYEEGILEEVIESDDDDVFDIEGTDVAPPAEDEKEDEGPLVRTKARKSSGSSNSGVGKVPKKGGKGKKKK